MLLHVSNTVVTRICAEICPSLIICAFVRMIYIITIPFALDYMYFKCLDVTLINMHKGCCV